MKKKATSGKERQAKYLAKIKADPLKYELHKKKERERWARNSQKQEEHRAREAMQKKILERSTKKASNQ